MRGASIAIACVVGCATGARPEPLPVPRIARGEVPAPPMPAYGGVRRTGTCAIAFAPADPIEAGRRTNAIAARLPADAIIELTALGDRARRVAIDIDRERLDEPGVRRLALAFVRDSADAWGTRADAISVRGRVEKDRRGRWSVEIGAANAAPAAWDFDEVLVVVRIDERHGRIEAGLVREPPPAATVCAGPEPALDRDRMREAVIADARARGRGELADADVGEPRPFLLADETTVRRVAAVSIGRDRDTSEGFVLVDPDSAEVIETRPPPYQGGIDPFYTPSSDAERVLDDR